MKILVGYDGSKAAIDAVNLAAKRARAMDAKLEVVYAITRSHPLTYTEVQSNEDELVRGIRDIFNGNNLSYETHLLLNDLSAADQLLEFAESHHIDEIIIGVRKRSKTGKLFLGSTAQHLVLNALCPVVTVK
jgi:nucleotide-binding universal stress UspA family protein